MTCFQLTRALSAIGSDAPQHEAAELIRVFAGKSREWCLLNRDTELPDSVADALIKRQRGIPLQYIIGEAWFYGYRFHVTPDCLIPQPDTELTVSRALELLPPDGTLLDLCTGSGCIAISVLNEHPSARAIAIDISKPALTVSFQNRELHKLHDRLRLIECDVLESPQLPGLIAGADVITSNPPYINSDVIPTLPREVQHEPLLALDGGSDGMIFYRKFISDLARSMKPSAVMLLEIGYDQSERVAALCESAQLSCHFHRDFGGNLRVAEIRRVTPTDSAI